jgi:hypothetical protein
MAEMMSLALPCLPCYYPLYVSVAYANQPKGSVPVKVAMAEVCWRRKCNSTQETCRSIHRNFPMAQQYFQTTSHAQPYKSYLPIK